MVTPRPPKRLVWVVDAYTTTNNYPSRSTRPLECHRGLSIHRGRQYVQANKINYMRNSVKAIVDAYDGSVRLFRWDDQDPILRTWERSTPQRRARLGDLWRSDESPALPGGHV